MIKTNYSSDYTYIIVIISIRFANGTKEKLCQYKCDIKLKPLKKIIDGLNTALIDKDGTPTLEFTNWIIENYPELNISDILDKDSKVLFEFVDSLPLINI